MLSLRKTLYSDGGADGSVPRIINNPKNHQERCHNIALILIWAGMVPNDDAHSFATAQELRDNRKLTIDLMRRKDREDRRKAAMARRRSAIDAACQEVAL